MNYKYSHWMAAQSSRYRLLFMQKVIMRYATYEPGDNSKRTKENNSTYDTAPEEQILLLT